MRPSRLLLSVILVLALAAPALAQDGPTGDQVFLALGDVDLTLEGVRIRSALSSDAGGTALLELADGTLIDLRLAAAQEGWSVRDIALVAGNADTYRGWIQPWRARVAAAQNFLAGMEPGSGDRRTAEELAPLSWFEDPDQSTRLWGMNPVTYRMMQTLQMMPALTGPMGGGTPTNPVPRRNDQ